MEEFLARRCPGCGATEVQMRGMNDSSNDGYVVKQYHQLLVHTLSRTFKGCRSAYYKRSPPRCRQGPRNGSSYREGRPQRCYGIGVPPQRCSTRGLVRRPTEGGPHADSADREGLEFPNCGERRRSNYARPRQVSSTSAGTNSPTFR